ncbi:MAG: hypothetical protein K1X64_11360 [Myxococcaceae bacterium]|nr:hypothetical protein [Myxococcaceae bacterium]
MIQNGRRALPVFSLSFMVLSACGTGVETGHEADDALDTANGELRTTYADLTETLSETELEKWLEVKRALLEGFDNICGDTLCGGDFSNLSTVRLQCSATTAAKKMKDCTWVLGGSIGYVNGTTGQIGGESRAFTCKIPIKGTAKTLLNTLIAAGNRALNTPLPQTNQSFYDGLVACFEGVVGSPIPSVEQPVYDELQDYFWAADEAQGLSWVQTRRKLNKGFDEVCGDSFCEGEYPNMTGLGFTCSVKRSSGYVTKCQWTFVAVDSYVDAKGAIVANTKTYQCPVEIRAYAKKLAATLNVDDPLHATLPGRNTSLYDALTGCL